MIQNQLLKCSYQWLGLKQENKLTLSCQSWLDLAKGSLPARCPHLVQLSKKVILIRERVLVELGKARSIAHSKDTFAQL